MKPLNIFNMLKTILITLFLLGVMVFNFSCNKEKPTPATRAHNPAKKPGDPSDKPTTTLPPLAESIQKSAVEYSVAAKLNFIDAKCFDSECSIKTANALKTVIYFSSPKILIDKIISLNVKADEDITLFYKTIKTVSSTTASESSAAALYIAVGFKINNTIYYISTIRNAEELALQAEEQEPQVLEITEPQVLQAQSLEFYISGVGSEAGDKIEILLMDSSGHEQKIIIGKALLSTLVDRDPYLDRKIKFSIIFDEKNILGFCIRNNKSVVF
jgi:hypothetical protein